MIKETKVCSKCKIEKMLNSDNFHRQSNSKDGYRADCKTCATTSSDIKICTPETKMCPKCKLNLPCTSEYFNKSSRHITGFESRCRVCRNSEREEYITPVSYTCTKCKVTLPCDINNFRKNKRSITGFTTQCRACMLDYDRLPEQKAKSKEYRNRPEIKEKHKQYVKQHQIDNPGVYITATSKYNAKKKDVNEEFTSEDRRLVYIRFNNKCYNCGYTEWLEVDHFRPISKGNPLTDNNAVILCRYCNASKRDSDPEGFFSEEQMKELSEVYKVY